jgi:hypothetical protein
LLVVLIAAVVVGVGAVFVVALAAETPKQRLIPNPSDPKQKA